MAILETRIEIPELVPPLCFIGSFILCILLILFSRFLLGTRIVMIAAFFLLYGLLSLLPSLIALIEYSRFTRDEDTFVADFSRGNADIGGVYRVDPIKTSGRMDVSCSFIDFSVLAPESRIWVSTGGTNSFVVSYTTKTGSTVSNVGWYAEIERVDQSPVAPGHIRTEADWTTALDRTQPPPGYTHVWGWDGIRLSQGAHAIGLNWFGTARRRTMCTIMPTPDGHLVVRAYAYDHRLPWDRFTQSVIFLRQESNEEQRPSASPLQP